MREGALRASAGFVVAALLAGVVCSCAARRSPEAVQGKSRPNVVFVLVDDLRWDFSSHAGHPFLETPNLDRLASEGVRFTNAFVTTSLCAPSRASILSGRYAHAHGVRRNVQQDMRAGIRTFPERLHDAGYRTAFLGKWHLRFPSRPRPGFDLWLSVEGYDGPGIAEDGRHDAEYVTDALTRRAVDWIQEDSETPFCLFLSHVAVHTPTIPAPRHAGRYAHVAIDPPPSATDDLASRPEALRRLIAFGQDLREFEASLSRPPPERIPPSPWKWGSLLRAQAETLLAVDEGLGRILEVLDRSERDDDTIVVFTSDNGFVLGEHQWVDKRLAWEESIRVPLLVRYPAGARAGAVVDELALNVDLAPTLLDLAGVEPDNGMQGRSLRPLLEGRRVPWRESFLYESASEWDRPDLPTVLALRTDRWKLVTYPDAPGGQEELYDLREDPHELCNLAADSGQADRLAEMRDALERATAETGYEPAPPFPAFRPGPERLVLRLELGLARGDTIADADGRDATGRLLSPARIESDGDRRALLFPVGGGQRIEFPPSTPLAPVRRPFSIRVALEARSPSGVVASHGGEGGWALYLDDGRPAFLVRSAGRSRLVTAPDSIVGRRTTLVAGLDAHGTTFLVTEDGERHEAGYPVGSPLIRPREGLCIGADPGEPVGPYEAPHPFEGSIETIELRWNAVSP